MLRGQNPYGLNPYVNLQHGYFLAQEFVPSNDFDVRVTITGDRAFVFRRFNRPGDFRASGSGRVDWDPKQVGEDCVRLGYGAAHKLGSQTLTVDIIRRGSELVIVELTLNYASWVVEACPGHWVLDGDPKSGKLTWVDGAMRAEDAIFDDFVGALRRSACATDTARHVTKPYLPLATRGHRIPT
jgi:hypothetical protein